MLTQRRKTGNFGEEKACEFLIARGYSILDRNYRTKVGEIDIVARKFGILVFVEVKTGVFGGLRPEENLTPFKIRNVVRSAQCYLINKKIPSTQRWQINALLISLLSDEEIKIVHIENINIV